MHSLPTRLPSPGGKGTPRLGGLQREGGSAGAQLLHNFTPFRPTRSRAVARLGAGGTIVPAVAVSMAWSDGFGAYMTVDIRDESMRSEDGLLLRQASGQQGFPLSAPRRRLACGTALGVATTVGAFMLVLAAIGNGTTPNAKLFRHGARALVKQTRDALAPVRRGLIAPPGTSATCPSASDVLGTPRTDRWHKWDDPTCSGCRMEHCDARQAPCCVLPRERAREPVPSFLRAVSSRQQCDADGTWYSCESKRCSYMRPCASHPGLLACACTPPTPAERKAAVTGAAEGVMLSSPCLKVEARKSIEYWELCEQYLRLPLETPRSRSCPQWRVPKLYHAVGKDATPPPAVVMNAAANPDFTLRYLGDEAARTFVRSRCGEAAAEAYRCFVAPAYRADIYRCKRPHPRPHPAQPAPTRNRIPPAPACVRACAPTRLLASLAATPQGCLLHTPCVFHGRAARQTVHSTPTAVCTSTPTSLWP